MLRWLPIAVLLLACAEDDAAPDEAICDVDGGRALLAGPFECDRAPASVTVEGFEIFTYEASHPRATAEQAFPCAVSRGVPIEAPAEPTEACSVSGVRPWHTVRWPEAKAACEAIGWRLCTSAELRRACAGPDQRPWTYGFTFEPLTCNVRDAYTPPDEMLATESPTGAFPECVGVEGAFDLTGNLREWAADAESESRLNQGGGWRTVAEAFREDNLRCDARVTVPAFNALRFASADVGFRCCR